jgi:hypothetical protein
MRFTQSSLHYHLTYNNPFILIYIIKSFTFKSLKILNSISPKNDYYPFGILPWRVCGNLELCWFDS